MRRSRRALLLVMLAVLATVAPSGPADAHNYWESGNIRIGGCALSGKYGCQAHYLRRWNSGGFGILYETRHSHVCTDFAGDGTWWRPSELRIYNQGTQIYSQTSHSSHQHTTEWCGQSVATHMWYPNVNSASGNNRWRAFTIALYAQGVTMTCGHHMNNFSGTSNTDPFGVRVSPSGGNC